MAKQTGAQKHLGRVFDIKLQERENQCAALCMNVDHHVWADTHTHTRYNQRRMCVSAEVFSEMKEY